MQQILFDKNELKLFQLNVKEVRIENEHDTVMTYLEQDGIAVPDNNENKYRTQNINRPLFEIKYFCCTLIFWSCFALAVPDLTNDFLWFCKITKNILPSD